MHKCVTATLAPELRRHNTRLALTSRLPPEVLCMPWEHLSVTDLLTVSHVCWDWRALALDSPHLWCNADITFSKHGSYCDCTACSAIYDGQLKCARCRQACLQGTTNADIARYTLSRSRTLPVSIHMQLSGKDLDFDYFCEDVGSCVDEYAHRLRELFVELEDPSVLGELLECSKAFPLLTILDCDINRDDLATDDPLGSNHFEKTIRLPDFPKLRSLLFRGTSATVAWEHCTLNRLAHLHCAFSTAQELATALSACPLLQSLHAIMTPFTAAPGASLELVRVRAATIGSITVSRVSAATESTVLAMFHRPSRPNFVLQYGETGETIHTSHGFKIFADLRDDIHISVDFSTPGFLISATDSAKRSRELQCARKSLGCIWGHVLADSITAVTVRALLWAEFAAAGMPLLANVRDLRVLSSSGEYYSDLEMMVQAPDATGRFPGLDTLCIVMSYRSVIAPSYVWVQHVMALIRLLKGNGRIGTFVLDGGILGGDGTALNDIVERIVEF